MPRWLGFGAACVLASAAALVLAGERRGRLALRLGLAGTSAALSGLLMGRIGVLLPRCEQLTLPIAGLPAAFEGLTIGVLGDFHLMPGYGVANLRWACAQLAHARPDLILLTGDFVDYRRYLALLRQELSGLEAPLGVFAMLGNHDYWFDPAEVTALVEDLGYTMLINEHRVLQRGGERLVLAGVDDPWYGDADLDEALQEAPPGAPVVLLAHVPDFIDHAAAAGVALQISGHSHAGHVSLPLLGPATLPWGAWRYHRGLYRVGSTWLYVNRGLGGRSLRLNAAPELTLLRLARDRRAAHVAESG